MDELSQAVEMLLNITRTELADNKPQQALAALLHAIRLTRGEDAIMEVLSEAKRKCMADIDQQVERESFEQARRITELLMHQDTFLSERGEEDILKDAFEDGSSVLCRKCGGLVAKARWESHAGTWCPAIAEVEMEMHES
jgi:predicted ArsR family transcriptional regulator